MDDADEWRVWLHLSLWTIQSSMCFASFKPKLSEVLILRVLLLRPCHCHVKSLVLLTAGWEPRYPTQGQTKLASGSDLQICEGAQPQWAEMVPGAQVPGQDQNSPAESVLWAVLTLSDAIFWSALLLHGNSYWYTAQFGCLFLYKVIWPICTKYPNPRHLPFSILSLPTTGIPSKNTLCHLIK